MGFDSIPRIETADFYLDVAFRAGRNAASLKKTTLKIDKFKKIKTLEIEKIDVVNKNLNKKLSDITYSFPNFENLTEFYEELVRTLIDYTALKKSLGSVNWAKNKIADFSREYVFKIKKCQDSLVIKKYSKEYNGRISSVMKQISKNLLFLDESRRVMKDFPSIKDGLFTIAIAGFPNVGKSTVLSKLTTSKPDIQAYAFTTKTLNVGYMASGHNKIQFIDTPGTLNRLDKMNAIEKIAYLAIKYCSELIIFIYDLTETYSLEDQNKLLKRMKEFDKPILIYLSKADLLEEMTINDFCKKNKDAIISIDVLKEKILNISI
ncbi:MAG: 50S ribosome-binding GTPase [Nanoarchaeota archaeon]|nr:50S ribosome-binding GTPase [Nanoarchaeota archaeon]MBU1270344.1 50S ribosome-binding GTPase [Nanoarchaeota archaeon]MBU1604659.1 50S ribosome-binding GTPase [Nanoarchaeota archaeon]MBU2443136.1 50S ribosome-binding GTPase [Nanoarchaeota archaeon]